MLLILRQVTIRDTGAYLIQMIELSEIFALGTTDVEERSVDVCFFCKSGLRN
jgi:hypothetical protein